jgi:acyl-CoA dehydrogenase
MTGLFPHYRPRWETDDQRLLRAHAANFFRKEATPNQQRWAEQHQVDREFWNKAGAAGLLCPELPDQYGGSDGNFGHEAVVQHELTFSGDSAFGFNAHSTICAHYIYAFGTEEQRSRWLPRVTTGEAVLAIAMTEPGTGSDLQAVRTTAVRDGDEYVVNGSKTFITNGSHCDLLIVVAKTDPTQGAKGISLFVVETDGQIGFQRGRILRKIGQHGQDTRELAFIEMRIPARNLIGETEGRGFYQLMKQLPRERLSIAVGGVAMAEAAVLEAVGYAKERQAFGKSLVEHQNTKFVLAECKADVLAGKTLIDHCIEQYLDGTLDGSTASIAKIWVSDMQCKVVDKCLQIFGGYGYIMEYPIARMYADARVQKIYGGTNEILKELIAREL